MMYRIRSLNIVRGHRLFYRTTYSTKSTNNETGKNSFFGRLWSNIREEMSKNKELKESLKNLRAEAEKLEQSDALKAAREKFFDIEKEATKNSDVLKERLGSIRTKVHEVISEAGKTDIARKAGKLSDDFSKTVSETSQQLGQSSAFKTISQVTNAVKKEIDNEVIKGQVYRSPIKLRKRKEANSDEEEEALKNIKIDDTTVHIELHKESKLYQSWQNFKDNNPYVNKIFEWKIRYDESSNPFVRLSRIFTDKLTSVTSGLFEKNELSTTLTELCRIDPQFQQRQFLIDCETDIIPNILEAMARNDLDILRDWCYEGPYNIFRTQIEQLRAQKLIMNTQILDIDHVDILSGKVVDDHGPVLFVTFQAQLITYAQDAQGAIIEGNPDKVYRANYIWALCRDPNELDPRAAWRLLECSMNMNEQFI